jgi:hypothetical protein
MKLISIEDQIIKATINALLAQNYKIAVDDGGGIALPKSTNADDILAAMRTTEEDYLLVHTPGSGYRRDGWVRFIYGNEDHEVINDYTVNLEPVMVKINEMIDKYMEALYRA